MSDDRGYVPPAYLEMTSRLVAPIKARSYSLMGLFAGARVADIGCGIGIDVSQLSRLVGPLGEVAGVDSDPAMIEAARRRAAPDPQEASPRFELAQSCALPFEAGYFDACRSERLFQHLEQPQQSLAEMQRVTRKGGRVVVLDTDWGSMSVDSAHADTERRLANFKAEHSLRNGFAGRRLAALFRELAFSDVSIEVPKSCRGGYSGSRAGSMRRVK